MKCVGCDASRYSPRLVHTNVVEVVTPSMDPVYMGVLIPTLSPLTVLVRVLLEKEGFFPETLLCIPGDIHIVSMYM